MKSKNVEALLRENEDLRDLLEDIVERIQEFREEMLSELGDMEDMVAKPVQHDSIDPEKVHV